MFNLSDQAVPCCKRKKRIPNRHTTHALCLPRAASPIRLIATKRAPFHVCGVLTSWLLGNRGNLVRQSVEGPLINLPAHTYACAHNPRRTGCSRHCIDAASGSHRLRAWYFPYGTAINYLSACRAGVAVIVPQPHFCGHGAFHRVRLDPRLRTKQITGDYRRLQNRMRWSWPPPCLLLPMTQGKDHV